MQRSRSRWYWGVLLAVAMGFASCDRRTVYFHYEHTPSAGWDKNDTLSFDVSPLSAGAYREELGLRIDNTFPFMGLSLVVKQTVLPSGYVYNDTLNCNLIDKNGNNKGAGISYFQYAFHLNTLRLQEGDSLHISVKHNMKREVMPGITDIGIRLDKQ